jgi:hypothetical protein
MAIAGYFEIAAQSLVKRAYRVDIPSRIANRIKSALRENRGTGGNRVEGLGRRCEV